MSTFDPRSPEMESQPFDDMQKLIDELRGELDRQHHQEPGWSGPITAAYLKGYGMHPRQVAHAEQARHRETHCNHGWYT